MGPAGVRDEAPHLPLNADVYFRLHSDFARAWWPHIDSQPGHSWVSLSTLGELVGRDYDVLPSKQRARFREDVDRAFSDLVAAGGLARWRLEAMGAGRKKSYRVHYEHALPKQGALDLLAALSGSDGLASPQQGTGGIAGQGAGIRPKLIG